MMKQKWIILTLGLLIIAGTCGCSWFRGLPILRGVYYGGSHSAPATPPPENNDFGAFGPASGSEALASLEAGGKIKTSLSGTGETIGHIADLTLQNVSGGAVLAYLPPTMLLSQSGKFQNQVILKDQTVALQPGASATVVLIGMCANCRKPPAGKNDVGELKLADPTAAETVRMVTACRKIATTARKLQSEGAFSTPFSDNPVKELNTVIQWAVWVYTSANDSKPIGKDDLARKVCEQAGKLTAQQSVKLEAGIDQLWAAIQLTGKIAKP